MIRLTCTNCKAVLEMDDAFAGGACRCQHCGTIQTVPSHLKNQPAEAAAHISPEVAGTGTGKPSKTLYQKPPPTGQRIGSGLDDLADIVASSGLRAGRLRTDGGTVTQAPPQPKGGRAVGLVLGGAVVALGIAAGIWWFVLRDGSGQSGVSPNPNVPTIDPGGGGDTVPRPIRGPKFFMTPVAEPTVIYLIDRGSGTQQYFSYLKEAVYRSIESLGSDRQFQIIFWDNDSGDAAFPADRLTYATKENAAAAQRALEDVIAFGQTDIKSALERAVAQKPAAILIATGKGWDLDENFVKLVSDTTKGSAAKIHTFAIGGASGSDALKQISDNSGGKFAEVTEGDLRRASE